MKSLREILKEAEVKGIAVGHFNISDIAALRAVFGAALEMSSAGGGSPPSPGYGRAGAFSAKGGPASGWGGKLPVIIGTSEGEREFIGPRQVVALVRSLSEEHDYPIFLNADHTHSLEKAEEAARAGYDEILFDGSKLPLEENIKQTKRAVEIIKSINPEILVEGEIGYIGGASEILKEIPEGAALAPENLTTPEEARRFVEETGVDVLAPAVGNMHGLLEQMVPILFPPSGITKSRIRDSDKVGVGTKGELQKHLDIERIKRIKEAVKIPLTLHGGSGTADKDFVAAIKAGIAIIHINTEIRIAWRRGVEEGLAKNPNEVAPYKILPLAVENIKKIVHDRLILFGGK